MGKLFYFSILFCVLLKCCLSDESKENIANKETVLEEVTSCGLYLNDGITGAVWDEMRSKKNIHLVKYNLHFVEYNNVTDPTKNLNGSDIYKLNYWYQAFSPQGLKLLTLALNYDIASLDILSLGVEEFDVDVVDGAPMCFAGLSPQNKLSAIFNFMAINFPHDASVMRNMEGPYCYQKVKRDDTKGKFVYECCKADDKVCTTLKENEHIKYFYFAILVVKILFFLMCPWIIQKLFFQKSLERVNYTVPINKPGLKKTMLIKRVNSEYETVNRSTKYSKTKLMQQFSNFRKLVKPIPSDDIVSVNFHRLDIVVEHNELMSKHESPVQLLQYLYANLIRCDCTKSDPFKTCCGESVVGSWSPSFLWCKLQKKCETNNSCRECCPWLAIFKCLGNILFIAALPSLFYLRAIIFYTYEKEEQENRRDFLDGLELKFDDIHSLTQILASHFCFLGLILCYLIAFIIFAVLKTLFHKQVDSIVNKCVTDFKNVNRFECFRMITAHAVLPFEKFGIFGFIFGAFYWPIVIPISILLTIFYCVPLLYITGRLLIHDRPSCLESFPSSNKKSQSSHSISRGVSSLTSCFLLDFISPNKEGAESHDEKNPQKTKSLLCCTFNIKKITSFLKKLLVGFLLIVVILSLCVMYAESVGFFVEVFSLLFLAALMNTDNTIIYFVFTCFMILHLCLALHYVKRRYLRFSQRLFRSIQLKLQQSILEKVMRNKVCKENYAFKYFSVEDSKDRSSTDVNCNEPNSDNSKMRKYLSTIPIDAENEEVDNIEYISGSLHWTVSSLVLFIGENDDMYMPRSLFWMTCNLCTLDGPGPLWKTLIKTFIALLFSVSYLLLLLLVFLFIDGINNMSSISQVFIFSVCSSIPSITYMGMSCFMQQKTSDFIVGERILWLIKNYRRSWPVSDLVFENPESPRQRMQESRLRFAGAGENQYGLENCTNLPQQNDYYDPRVVSSEHQMPLKVDLLITLKDEETRESLMRGSMVSNGSAQSLTSITRISPEEGRQSRIVTQPNTNMVPNIANQLQKPLLISAADNSSSDGLPPIEIELNDLKVGSEIQTN